MAHIYYLRVFVGQESRHGLTTSFTSGSHNAAIKVLAGGVVLSEGWAEKGASKLTPGVAGGIQFLTSCWSAISLISLPHGPLHTVFHNMVTCFIKMSKWEGEREFQQKGEDASKIEVLIS